MEIEIDSNDHKVSDNKLKYYFNDKTKFENNTVSLKECIFIVILKILNQFIQ